MSTKVLLTVLVSLATSVAYAGDWPRFRGPNGTGISLDKNATPVTWSPTENLKWKLVLPGAGASSPIVFRDRVYVTCYSGYAADPREPGNQKDLKRHLVCADRATGKILWSKTVDAVLPEDEYSGIGVPQHGYASHTPVADSQRVYVFFGKSGALAFDHDGKQLWQTPLGTGTDPRNWGSASSPILYKNLLIVTASSESRSLVALDVETGREVWKQTADGFESTWGTPVLAQVDDSRSDLVIGVPFEIWAFNPDTGKLRWFCEAMDTDSYCSSVVSDGDVIYGIEGRNGGSIAVRVGGEGDIKNSHVVWSGRNTSRIGTPVVYDGRIYFFANGIANCIDAKTGKDIYQERLSGGTTAAPSARSAGGPGGPPGRGGPGGGPGGPRGRGMGGGGMGGGMSGDYASPVVAEGKLYYTTRSGNMFVIQLGSEFRQLAVNRVTEDVEDFSGTPAISNGELFIRSNKHLYCVAEVKRE
jgi:outer membrane protein assembly factor BamB